MAGSLAAANRDSSARGLRVRINSMKRIRFRLLLSVAVFALTVGLLIWGHVEEQEFWSRSSWKPGGWDLVMVWDYMPAGRRLALNLNFPVALAYQPLHPYLLDHTQVGPPPWHHHIPFLVAVPILWYWVGRGLDRYRGLLPYDRHSPRGPIRSAILWLSLLGCVLILGITTLAFSRGYVPITALFLGSILWSLGFLVYCLRQLHRRPFRLWATSPQ